MKNKTVSSLNTNFNISPLIALPILQKDKSQVVSNNSIESLLQFEKNIKLKEGISKTNLEREIIKLNKQSSKIRHYLSINSDIKLNIRNKQTTNVEASQIIPSDKLLNIKREEDSFINYKENKINNTIIGSFGSILPEIKIRSRRSKRHWRNKKIIKKLHSDILRNKIYSNRLSRKYSSILLLKKMKKYTKEYNWRIRNYQTLPFTPVNGFVEIDYKSFPINWISKWKQFSDRNKQILTNYKTKLEGRSNIRNTKKVIMNKFNFIKKITPFYSELASTKNIMYNFNKQNTHKIVKNEQNIFAILESAFLSMSSFISKPIFLIKPNSIKIQIFFYWNPLRKKFKYSKLYSKFWLLKQTKLQNLIEHLSKLLNKPIELDITRIYYPQFDSNILVNLIGFISYFIKMRIITRKLFSVTKIKKIKNKYKKFKYTLLPAFTTGINIKTAGRILAKRLKRKIKSKTIQKGSLARTKTNLINTSRFTNKNKTGSFSITIKTGNLIVN